MDDRAKGVMEKIEECMWNFLVQLKDEIPRPCLKLSRSLGSKAIVLKRDGSRHFENVVLTLAEIHQLLKNDRRTTKRDIYYQGKRLFGHQRSLDSAVRAVCDLLQEERIYLNIRSTSKGLIAGDLRFGIGGGGEVRDCRDGIGMPSEWEDLHSPHSNARFILVLEKDAVFQTLLDEGFTHHYPSILVTGKGYPDIQTRRMVKSLVEVLQIPVLGLMDADPHGMEIFCVYKFGPGKPGFENSNLQTPQMKWLGVFPSDVWSDIPLGPDQMLPLTEHEISKIRKLLERKEIEGEPRIVTELNVLLQSQKKLEIEAISSLRPCYLSEVYIPRQVTVLFESVERTDQI